MLVGVGLLILVHPKLEPTVNARPSNCVFRPAAYFFFGGILMLIGAIGEWIVGNTFPFVVFGTFGKLPFHTITPILEAQ